MEPLLAPKWGKEFHCAVAGEKWLDFTLADKGTGLQNLCAALHIAPGEAAAFGDNFNDLPMLRLAGFPYIMDNAAPALRAQFSRHCRRVEDILRSF